MSETIRLTVDHWLNDGEVEPAPLQPSYVDHLDDGTPVRVWFSKRHHDEDCDDCARGECVQRVVEIDGMIIVEHMQSTDLN